MKKNIYLFGGLGANERVYNRLDFPDFLTTIINWEIPQKKETIENYATRLLTQIKTSQPILIGISFGGLIAIEIAKIIDTELVIIISSAKTKKEIPFYYRWAGKLNIHKLLPIYLLKKDLFSDLWFRSCSDTDKQLIKKMFSDTNPIYIKWAIDRLIKWQNQIQPQNIKHIHGTNDRVFPIRYVSCDIRIENGGHYLILMKSQEISHIIRIIIKRPNSLPYSNYLPIN